MRAWCWMGVAMGLVGCAPEMGDLRGPADCLAWCDLMADACPGNAIQPLSSCQAYCENAGNAATENGDLADVNGNSWGCRMHWATMATVASSEEVRAMACASAHVSGGGVCGEYCDQYCDLAELLCREGDAIYESREACARACALMPGVDAVLTGVSVPAQQFGYGDTVVCRMHHLHAAAYESNARIHCPHAAQPPHQATCSDTAPPNLTNYCNFASMFCSDLLEDVATLDECRRTVGRVMSAYREEAFASFADMETNSIGCLNYWIMKAPLDPARYCPLADYDPSQWTRAGGMGMCSE